MEAVRRLLRLAGQLRRGHEASAASAQASARGRSEMEQLRDMWCVPWRPVQDVALLVITSNMLTRLHALKAPPAAWALDEVQLLVRIARVAGNALVQLPPYSQATVPGMLPDSDIRQALFMVLEAVMPPLVSWAARFPASTPSHEGGVTHSLAAECLVQAAVAASDVSDVTPGPQAWPSPSLVEACSALWVHAARVRACEAAVAMDRLRSLWLSRRTGPVLVGCEGGGGGRVLRHLGALLDGLPSADPSLQRTAMHTAVAALSARQHDSRLPLQALEVLARATAEVARQQQQQPERAQEAGGAVLELLTSPPDRLQRGVAAVAAVALTTQMAPHAAAMTEASRQTEVWAGMCRQQVAMAEGAMVAGAPSAEEGGYRAALAVALTLLGTGVDESRPVTSWCGGREAGLCLAGLLRLALGDVVDPVPSSPLAAEVSEQWVLRTDRLAEAVVGLFRWADAAGQAEALTTIRAFTEALVTVDETGSGRAEAGTGEDNVRAVLLVLQVCLRLVSSSRPGVCAPEQACWVVDVLGHLAALALDSPLEPRVYQALESLRVLVESRPDEAMITAVRDHVLQQWAADTDARSGLAAGLEATARQQRRHAFLLRAAAATCLESSRPAPYEAVSAVLQGLLRMVGDPVAGPLLRRDAHVCLRAVVANPRVLAYRAGLSAHWDEARRRVLVSYVKAALTTFPAHTSERDLAYCIGSAIGGLPHDVTGQRVLIACLSLLAEKARDLWLSDPACNEPSTAAITKLLFQTLVLCPARTIRAGLVCVSDFVQGLGEEASKRLALGLLRDTIGSDSESERQAELAKWYLVLVDRALATHGASYKGM